MRWGSLCLHKGQQGVMWHAYKADLGIKAVQIKQENWQTKGGRMPGEINPGLERRGRVTMLQKGKSEFDPSTGIGRPMESYLRGTGQRQKRMLLKASTRKKGRYINYIIGPE